MFRLFEKANEDNGGGNSDTVEEQDFIEIQQDEEEGGAPELKPGDEGYVAPIIHAKKFDFGRFKTYNPELEEDEDKAAAWLEEQVKENRSLKLLVKGREVIEQDPEIMQYKTHLKKDEETLFKTAEIMEGIQAGESAEDAERAAEAKYARLKENNPDAITEKVRKVRGSLNGFIANKEKEILAAQEAARQNIRPEKVSKEVSETAVGEVAKLDSILGIRLSYKDKSKLAVLTGKAETAISSGSLMKKLQEDPKLLAKVAFIVENEAEYVKNIKKLGKGQATILNKMQNKDDKQIIPKSGGGNVGAGQGSKTETQKISEANW